jgi:hypothetical protein
MSFLRPMSLMRHVSLLSAVAAFTLGSANAQSTLSHDALASTESSSLTQPFDSSSADPGALPANPNPSGAAVGQEGGYGQNGGYHSHGMGGRLTFEAGAGFNAPVGNDLPYITWGGNLTLGGGLRFSRGFSILGEYQFMDNKLPGAFVASGGGTGLFPKWNNSAYVVGGAGWYHKSTNFTVQECCDFYGYPVTLDADSFSSNQFGANLGLGFSHRMGGMYGDGKTRLFAEARYTYINTPKITETNGFGRTELIPVTLGLRF